MTTPRFRFTVMPVLMAIVTALAMMPTNVVKVASRGLGLEHEQPWRSTSLASGLVDRVLRPVLSTLQHVRRHALFGPGLIAAAAVAGAIFVDPISLYALPIAFGAVVTSPTVRTGQFLAWESTSAHARELVNVLAGQVLPPGSIVGRISKGVGRVSTPTVSGTGNGTMTAVSGGPETQVGNYVVKLITVAANGGTFSVTNPSGKLLPNATVGTPYRTPEINFTINDGSTDFALNDTFTIVADTTMPTNQGTGNGVISAVTMGPDAIPGNYRFEIIEAITNGGGYQVTGPDGDVMDTGYITAGAGGTAVNANSRQLNFTVTEGSTDFAVGDAINLLVFNNAGSIVAWDPTAVDGRDDVEGVLIQGVDATSGTQQGVIVARDAVVVKGALSWAAAVTAAQKESAYKQLAAKGIIARDSVVP